jgi:CheY-like chemotaxis protein
MAFRGSIPKHVLLAEDDASTRRVLASTLRTMGLEVIEADDGGRMLVALAEYYKDGRSPEDLDLVVTDVAMPVVGGLDVFRELRAARWTTPCIVVTANDSPHVRESAARLGAVLLEKPLDLDVLERTVHELLAEADRRRRSLRKVRTHAQAAEAR